MASRMDRYYQNEKVDDLRTKKNKELYESIYNDTEYTNIEGIASISKADRIDMSEIRKLLNSNEDQKEDEQIQTRSQKTVNIEKDEPERTYDIRDILNKAKDTSTVNNKYHSLKNQDYDFLKNVDIKKEEEDVDRELDNLVNTLTNADLLSNIDDTELSLNLLSELKPSGETKVSENLKNLIKEEAKNYHKKEDTLDQTFFTKENSFSKEDFADYDEDEIDEKHSKKGLFVIFIITLIIMLIIVYLLVIRK